MEMGILSIATKYALMEWSPSKNTEIIISD